MAFTTPCFVRIEDTEKLKRIGELLEKIGYRRLFSLRNGLGDVVAASGTTARSFYQDHAISPHIIDCGTDIDLFMVLADIRDDRDQFQYFVANKDIFEVVHDEKNMFQEFHRIYRAGELVFLGGYFTNSIELDLFHKATAEEIIEHFKSRKK